MLIDQQHDAASEASALLGPETASAEVGRTAFTLQAVHTRRDDARITCLAQDPRLRRLFLGLSTGCVEEHQLLFAAPFPGSTPAAPAPLSSAHSTQQQHQQVVTSTRLLSARKFFKHGVADLCCLPVAHRLVARSHEGSLMMGPYDGANLLAVPQLKNVVAMAGDGTLRAPARLAVACKSGGSASKLCVCMVGGGPGGASSTWQPVQVLAQLAMPEPILALAWAGDSILMAMPGHYRLVVSGGAMVEIAPHTARHPMLAPITPSKQALLLLADTMLVVADASGSAVSAPLLLRGVPLALASVGSHVLSVSDDEVEVMDRASGALLQSIAFMHDDAWAQAAHRLPHCTEDWGQGYLVFATSTSVHCLGAVPPEQQVHELIKRRRFAAALTVVSAHCRPQELQLDGRGSAVGRRRRRRRHSSPRGLGVLQQAGDVPGWCWQVVMETAVLLLQELRFLPALLLLLLLPPSVWQPCQLLLLFPRAAAQWTPREQLPRLGRSWGLHDELADLERLVHDRLELEQATQPHTVCSSAASSPRHHHDHHHHYHAPLSLRVGSPIGDTQQAGAPQRQAGVHLVQAKALVAAYLQMVRGQPGVQAVEALDTLLLQLLLELGLVGEAEAACSRQGCQALLKDAAPLLTACRRWHALALLRTTHNHHQEALDVWEGLGTCALTEDATDAQPTMPVQPTCHLPTTAPVAAGQSDALRGHGTEGGAEQLGNVGRHTQVTLAAAAYLQLAQLAASLPAIAHSAGVLLPAASSFFTSSAAATSTALPTAFFPQPALHQQQQRGAALGFGNLPHSHGLGGARPSSEHLVVPIQGPAFMSLLPDVLEKATAAEAELAQHRLLALAGLLPGTGALSVAGPPAPACTPFAMAMETAAVVASAGVGAFTPGGPQQLAGAVAALAAAAWAAHSGLAAAHGDQRALAAAAVRELLSCTTASVAGPGSGAPWGRGATGPAPSLSLGSAAQASGGTLQASTPPPPPPPAGAQAAASLSPHHEPTLLLRPQPGASATVVGLPHPSRSPLPQTLDLATAAMLGHQPSGSLHAGRVRVQPPTPRGISHHVPPPPSPHGSAQQQLQRAVQVAFSSYFEHASTWSDLATSHVALPAPPQPAEPVDAELALAKLPWLLDSFPGDALAVLASRPDLPLPGVLQLLQARADDVRWRYLHHLVHLTIPTAASGSGAALYPTSFAPSTSPATPAVDPAAELAAAAMVAQPQQHQQQQQQQLLQLSEGEVAALHTELALELLECIAREVQRRQQQQQQRAESEAAPGAAGGPAMGGTALSPVASSALAMSSMPSLHHAFSAMMMASSAMRARGAAPHASQPSLYHLHSHPHMHPHPHTQQQQQDDEGPGGQRTGPAAAHDPAAASRLGWLRAVLSVHLAISRRYDAGIVLEAVHSTGSGDLLLHEQVQLQQRQGDHGTALQLLVVRLGDVDSAIAYCRQQQHALLAAQQQQQQEPLQWQGARARALDARGRVAAAAAAGMVGDAEAVGVEMERLWMCLLECCLRPGEGRLPMYDAALRVLAAPSAPGGGMRGAAGLLATPQLDPLKVLGALPDAMPLSLAAETLARMMTATTHQHRNAQVLKALYRTQNLEVKAVHLALTTQRVVITEHTTCKVCHRLIGGRVFIRSPTGLILCDRCARMANPNPGQSAGLPEASASALHMLSE